MHLVCWYVPALTSLETKGNSMAKKALKLYVLKDESGAIALDAFGNPQYFSDKMLAKSERKIGQHVSYGPDHKKFKTTTGKGN